MWSDLMFRIRALLRRGAVERELDEELRAHLQYETQKHVEAGWPPAEAERRARLAIGGLDAIREECRDARGTRALEDFAADLGHGARLLRRNPSFAVIALVCIALAIGVNSAVFSVVDAVLLRTLPVRDPSRLVFLKVAAEDGDLHAAPPYPCVERFQGARTLSGFAAFDFDLMPIVVDGHGEQALVQHASASYFDVLGVTASLGRTFVATDDRLEPPVAVLGYQYWQRRFGGAPDVLGRTIVVNDRVLTIVGVSSPGFTGLQSGAVVDVTVPFSLVGAEPLTARGRWGWFDLVARLEPGVAREQAEAELDSGFQAFMNETGASAELRANFSRMAVTPAGRGLDELREEVARPLMLGAAIAAIVLLIACANVAILLLARAGARQHEFATRMAIGATRLRLVRQLLTESLLLGAIGTCAGLAIARAIVAIVANRVGAGSGPFMLDLPLDYRVVLFSAALCLATSLLFGLTPAVRSVRVAILADLKRPGAGALARRARFSHGAMLVVAQITLSLILLVATALLAATLVNLRQIDPGFRPDGVTTFELQLLKRDPSAALTSARWTAILDRVTAVPAVESASASWLTPLGRRDRGVGLRVIEEGRAVERPGLVVLNHVSPDYFATMSIPLRRGRPFTPRDDDRAEGTAILSETAARDYFGAADPIGRRVVIAKRVREIVGVAGDIKHQSLRDEIRRFVYVPLLQPVDNMDGLFLAVRARPGAGAVAAPVRAELSRLGSEIVIGGVTTMPDQIDRTLMRERLLSTLSGSLAALGVVLAAVGLFGVMSSSVLRRRGEIAVRMAFGASGADVRRGVLRQSLWIAMVGILPGIPLSLIGARVLTSLLFGIQPTDPLVVTASAVTLIMVAALAGYWPARRASRLDPAAVLRSE